MPSTKPDRETLASLILEFLPAAKIQAAKFVGADALVVAKKMAINKMLAAEEPHVVPKAIAAADSDPQRGGKGVNAAIFSRKQKINQQLRAEEAGAWR